MNELKLYVWEQVFCLEYCGVAFALAHSVEEARQLIALRKYPKEKDIEFYRGRGEEYRADIINVMLAGKPDEIYDAPVGYVLER